MTLSETQFPVNMASPHSRPVLGTWSPWSEAGITGEPPCLPGMCGFGDSNSCPLAPLQTLGAPQLSAHFFFVGVTETCSVLGR